MKQPRPNVTGPDGLAYRAAVEIARDLAHRKQESAYVLGINEGEYLVKPESQVSIYEHDLIVAGANP